MSCTSGRSYNIKAGDTLYLIAEREMGDGNRWHEIKKPNGTPFTEDEARSLWVGQEVCIPGSGTTGNNMVQEILAAHNRYRAEVGVPPLRRSNNLANRAQQWANHLAAIGSLEHSGPGENLWMGTAGHYSFTDMVGSWGSPVKVTFLP